jgi:hypothetical protein
MTTLSRVSGRRFQQTGMLMTTGDSIFGFTKSYLGLVAVEWIALAAFVILFCADVILALHHLF